MLMWAPSAAGQMLPSPQKNWYSRWTTAKSKKPFFAAREVTTISAQKKLWKHIPIVSGVWYTPILWRAKSPFRKFMIWCRTRVFPEGTPFQKQVWQALRKIPYGQTATYGEIAAAVGIPKGARAIGRANHENPIAILIPCHRVVGANGKLTGYAAGIEIKKALLTIEQGEQLKIRE